MEKESYYFNILNSSYIDSRYKKEFKINKNELLVIENKIIFL
jgi:hypothetical protein